MESNSVPLGSFTCSSTGGSALTLVPSTYVSFSATLATNDAYFSPSAASTKHGRMSAMRGWLPAMSTPSRSETSALQPGRDASMGPCGAAWNAPSIASLWNSGDHAAWPVPHASAGDANVSHATRAKNSSSSSSASNFFTTVGSRTIMTFSKLPTRPVYVQFAEPK